MQRVFGFLGHLIGAMLKGFFFTGVAAAILCAVILFSPSRTIRCGWIPRWYLA